MDPYVAGALISGVGSLASGLGSTGLSYSQSKDLMKYQYDLQQEAIDRQNLYNSPAEQMKRLAAANLNPNLVYGSGVDGNQSSAASPSQSSRHVDLPNPLQDFDTALANKRLLELQEIRSRNEAFESRERRLNLAAKTIQTMLSNKLTSRTMHDNINIASQRFKNMLQEARNLKASEYRTYADTRRLEAQTENLYEETHLIHARTQLNWQQSFTEAVKRNLMRSNIQVNNKKMQEIDSYIEYLNAGTDLRNLGHDVQELEFEATKAYKEWKKKHPNAQLTLDMIKEGLGLGGQVAGIASKFIP